MRPFACALTVGLWGPGDAHEFVPFAGIEELKPRPFHHFCKPNPQPDEANLQRCEHQVNTVLEDGGEVKLHWKMDVDPDNFLSLDTLREHGLRLVECMPGDITAEVPEKFVKRVRTGTIVVGSHFAHSCTHLGQKHMYHRVTKVAQHSWVASSQKIARMRLLTDEFPSFSHVVPSADIHFSYMPVEALDTVEFPQMRTNFGHPEAARKLQVTWDDGGGSIASKANTHINNPDSMINFTPKQISNFGWNWDFFLNSTEEPEFNVTFPGGRGYMKLRQPYVRVHAGIYLNVSSKFHSLTGIPHVQWQAGIKGHGAVSLRMITEVRTTSATLSDPFHELKIPQLERLEKTMWLQPMNFAAGEVPMSVEPGFQMKTRMYHRGAFDGTLQLGGKTRGTLEPQVSFDSIEGLKTSFTGKLLDTELWPPLWMISTDGFEMGTMLEPEIKFRGQFGGHEDATIAIEARPYLNLTLQRAGQSSHPSGQTNPLVVYPFRIVGLSSTRFNTRYRVKIQANGAEAVTQPHLNWGDVDITDHVSNFQFGYVDKRTVLTQSISVSLIEVGSSGETVIGSAQISCTSLLNGECQPSPSIAHIPTSTGQSVQVHLDIVWRENPMSWFASKIRGLSLSFPSVVVADPSMNATGDLALRLTHNGRTYPVTVTSSGATPILHGQTVIELGTQFLDSWGPCSASKCQSGQLELYRGTTLLASSNLPTIPWSAGTRMQGTSHSLYGFMHGLSSGSPGSAMSAMVGAQMVPVTVALHPTPTSHQVTAVINMKAQITEPSSSSLFLKPNSPTEVALGTSFQLIWGIAGTAVGNSQTFTLVPWKVVADSQSVPAMPQVGNRNLQAVTGLRVAQTLSCSTTTVADASVDKDCTYQYSITWDSTYVSSGDVIVVEVQWSSSQGSHKMYSSPLQVISSTSGRRLWTQADWDSRLAANKQNCEKRDLHFRVGTGLLVRGKMENMDVPSLVPMVGGLREGPQLTTGFRSIAAFSPGDEDVRKIFPKALCAGGICQGQLPGCTDSNFNKKFFPTVRLNLNRRAHFPKNPTQAESIMQRAIAYAFSMLPEFVEVVLRELNGTNTTAAPATTTTRPATTAAATAGSIPLFQTVWAPMSSTGSSMTVPSSTSSSISAITLATTPEATHGDTTARPIFGQFPGLFPAQQASTTMLAARRLNSKTVSQRRTFDSLITVSFKHGMHYTVDRPLVNMMIQNQMFAGLRDDRGPIYIQDFSIQEANSAAFPDSATWKTGRHASKQDQAQFMSVSNILAVLCVVSALLATLSAAIVFIRYRLSARLMGYKRNLHSAHSAEEESPFE